MYFKAIWDKSKVSRPYAQIAFFLLQLYIGCIKYIHNNTYNYSWLNHYLYTKSIYVYIVMHRYSDVIVIASDGKKGSTTHYSDDRWWRGEYTYIYLYVYRERRSLILSLAACVLRQLRISITQWTRLQRDYMSYCFDFDAFGEKYLPI